MDRFQSPTSGWWGGTGAASFPSDWSSFTDLQPFGLPQQNWAAQQQGPWTYDQGKSARGMSYDPIRSSHVGYEPFSSFTSRGIFGDVENYLRAAYPENYAFESEQVNPGTGTGGDVSQSRAIGRFHEDPRVYTEIEQAAAKHGVPANLIKAMIARESSGHWGAGVGPNGPYDNTKLTWLGSRNQWIAGYTGITENAAKDWGYDIRQIGSNRAAQIEAMAKGLKIIYSRVGQQHGWDGVIATYYSGDPTAATTPSDSGNYGTTRQYLNDVKNWWKAEDAWVRANGGQVGSPATSGLSTPNNTKWQPINQWDNFVAQASSKYNVPANLIKAVMQFESKGDPKAVSPGASTGTGGAVGLMQVMPGMHGLSAQQLLDPATNVNKGAEILRRNFDQYGSWELAAKAYLAGNPYSTKVDYHETGVGAYWSKIRANWDELNAAASGVYGGQPRDPGPVLSNINMIWGGASFPITQEHGPTHFSQNVRPDWYDYSITLLGTRGHPGIDVGTPRGTQIFTPVGGTVELVGTGHYRDAHGGPGQIAIRLDNGHMIIFGHMASSAVTVGPRNNPTRVQPGQLIGTSGTYNGDHLHLEYRIPGKQFGGEQVAIDPREALRGLFTGTLSSPNQALPGVGRPYTYADLLKTAASGGNFFYGSPIGSGGSTWNNWLQGALAGDYAYGSRTQGELAPNATTGYQPRANPLTTPQF